MNYRLEKQDCLIGMAAIPGGSVDALVTSPPFNLRVKYKSYEDARAEKDYLAWTDEWAHEVKRLLHPEGSFFLNFGSAANQNPWLPMEVMCLLRRQGWFLQNTIHWIKSITLDGPDGDVSRGHFKPINSKRYLNDCHEYIYHLTPTGTTMLDRLAVGVPYADKSNISRWGHTQGQDRRCRGNNWFIPYETRNRKLDHPASFPVALPSMCLKLHGGTVEGHYGPAFTACDPFLGTGATAVAAMRLGVPNFVGFEIDDTYVREARRRVLTT